MSSKKTTIVMQRRGAFWFSVLWMISLLSLTSSITESSWLTGGPQAASAQPVNSLPNGSFEAAFDKHPGNAWGGYLGGQSSIVRETLDEYRDHHPVVDSTTSVDGRQSWRLELLSRSGYIVASPQIAVVAGRAYTASVAIKSSVPTSVTLGLEGAQLKSVHTTGSEWKRYTVSGVAPAIADGVNFTVQVTAPDASGVTVWIDAAQLEEGVVASTNFIATYPVELALRLSRAGNIVHEGEDAPIHLLTAGNLPAGARLKATLSDLYGGVTELPRIALPAESFSVLTSATAQPLGLFKLRAQVLDAEEQPLSAPVDLVFTRLPRPREIEPEKSYFGVHIPLSRDWLRIARALGARWVRLHDASKVSKWRIVEESPDQFRYFDESVALAREMGLEILGMLDGAPPWVSSTPQATEGYFSMYNLPNGPNGPERWRRYIETLVGRYAGQIDYWEVWNEPWYPPFFPGGTPEQYGELLRTAYTAAKQANPNAVILGINTIATEDDYTRRVLAATGTNYFDVFSFHEYNESFFGGVNNVAQARAEKFRQMQEDYGPSRPLWISEGGPGVRSGSLYNIGGLGRSPRDQMAHAVRMEASLIAAGIQKFFHYSMEINAPPGSVAGPYETLENDRSPRALLVGRAVLASLIDGAISIGRTEPAPGVEAYTFQQTDGSVVTVIWSYDGLTHTLSLARGTILLDILRNEIKTFGSFTVGDEPVYVEQFLRPQIRRQETPPRRIGP